MLNFPGSFISLTLQLFISTHTGRYLLAPQRLFILSSICSCISHYIITERFQAVWLVSSDDQSQDSHKLWHQTDVVLISPTKILERFENFSICVLTKKQLRIFVFIYVFAIQATFSLVWSQLVIFNWQNFQCHSFKSFTQCCWINLILYFVHLPLVQPTIFFPWFEITNAISLLIYVIHASHL